MLHNQLTILPVNQFDLLSRFKYSTQLPSQWLRLVELKMKKLVMVPHLSLFWVCSSPFFFCNLFYIFPVLLLLVWSRNSLVGSFDYSGPLSLALCNFNLCEMLSFYNKWNWTHQVLLFQVFVSKGISSVGNIASVNPY